MRAVAARRSRWTAARTGAAAAAGAALRQLRHLPEAAGALLVAYGAGLAWPPAGYIVLGGFLLLAGRNT